MCTLYFFAAFFFFLLMRYYSNHAHQYAACLSLVASLPVLLLVKKKYYNTWYYTTRLRDIVLFHISLGLGPWTLDHDVRAFVVIINLFNFYFIRIIINEELNIQGWPY